jgi:hypothetical protein
MSNSKDSDDGNDDSNKDDDNNGDDNNNNADAVFGRLDLAVFFTYPC